jgi:hypothetical protein
MLGTILLIILILMLPGSFPAWPHSRSWGYGPGCKEKWDQKLADFETKRDAAQAKLIEVKDNTAEAWEDLRKGAQAAWEDMDKAFHEASHEFGWL